MIDKNIVTRLVEMYIKDRITKEELDRELDKLTKKDMPEPPTIY